MSGNSGRLILLSLARLVQSEEALGRMNVDLYMEHINLITEQLIYVTNIDR